MSGHLHLVGESFTPNDRHSVHTDIDTITELAVLATKGYGPAGVALKEMQAAIERRDVDAVVAACSRLSSAAELARQSSLRLQRSVR